MGYLAAWTANDTTRRRISVCKTLVQLVQRGKIGSRYRGSIVALLRLFLSDFFVGLTGAPIEDDVSETAVCGVGSQAPLDPVVEGSPVPESVDSTCWEGDERGIV